MLKFIIACVCCFLSSCAFWSEQDPEEQQFYYRINEAYDFEVTHCDSFAMARGKGNGKFGITDAKNQAMKYGEEIGGTHLVWLHVDEGKDKEMKVVAVIYKCQQ